MATTSVGQACIDAAATLIAKFESAPIAIERREMSLVLKPMTPDSFEVSIFDEGEEAVIAAERWHAHYDDPDQLAACAMWLLTPFYRVVHELKNGVLAAVWIERYALAGWEPMEPVYFMNPNYEPDWRPGEGARFSRRYIQQSVLWSPQPYERFVPGIALDGQGLPVGSRLGVSVQEVDAPLGPSLASED